MTSLLCDLLGSAILLGPFIWVLGGGAIMLTQEWREERRYRKRWQALLTQREATDRRTHPE
jgi:hypothetical protein